MENLVMVKELTYQSIFQKLNLDIRKGKITFLSGANKCGKTTLIKIISGMIATKNMVVFDHSYMEETHRVETFSQVGVMMPYERLPFLFSTVYQELAFPLENLEYSREQIKSRIQEVSASLKLESVLQQNPKTLSLFEKNKVLLALAIIHKPKLLLLDDPCSMLTKGETKFILDCLKKLQKKDKMTIIVTTDNLEETLWGDYLYILKAGKIVLEGKPISVLQEETILTRLGLRLPFLVDLSLKLKFYDLLDDVILDLDKMVNLLWK